MVKLILSKNNSFGSRLIRWATKLKGQKMSEIPSHFSVEFWDFLVVESVMIHGIRINSKAVFREHNKIVFEKELNCTREEAKELFRGIITKYMGQKYDYLGAMYLGFRKLMTRFFGFKELKRNRLDKEKRQFCSELYEFISGEEGALMSPNDVYLKLK